VPARYLPIYLNDHLTGATIGVELVKRACRANQGSELGTLLEELSAEIAADRESLLSIMRSLAITPSRAKVVAGWTAEKLGRLKLNGEITQYSPLSRLLELEGLDSGIGAKLAMWAALQEIREHDERLAGAPLDELVERARSQRARLEPHRLVAALTAFGD
jgi:hypothetical protein